MHLLEFFFLLNRVKSDKSNYGSTVSQHSIEKHTLTVSFDWRVGCDGPVDGCRTLNIFQLLKFSVALFLPAIPLAVRKTTEFQQ